MVGKSTSLYVGAMTKLMLLFRPLLLREQLLNRHQRVFDNRQQNCADSEGDDGIDQSRDKPLNEAEQGFSSISRQAIT
ncbi:MAG: hypothetical protein JXQ99_14705 [Hyphomicrobiaceae bacterium]